MGLPVTQGAYNLLEEKWIPVLYSNGKTDRVGICQVLTDACEIRQIAASNPMDRVALLRFLLAVLMWCKEDAKSSLAALDEKNSGIPENWLGRLKEHKAAFNLLGDGKRFYQDLNAATPDVGASNLMHEFPSGSKIAHFRHIRDDSDGLCLGCCALALVRWSVLASAGTAGARQSMTASLNGNTPSYTFHAGPNLFITLRRELQRLMPVEKDRPVWDGADEKTPIGPLKAFTWRSRCVRLAPPSENGERNLREGRCSYCEKQSDRIVYTIRFRPGWKRNSSEPWRDDPHLLRLDVHDKQIVPSWPSPNDALEHHAETWSSVMQGILNRTTDQNGTKYETVLVAAVQALYKHIASHSLFMAALDQERKNAVRAELDWARRATWATVSARTGKGKTKEKVWGEPPKGHAIVESLHGQKSLGHEIRSSLCALSSQTHVDMENCFRELLLQYDVKEWRQSVKEILIRVIEQVVRSTITGSLLQRREALARARSALESTLNKTEHGDALSEAAMPSKPKRGRKKRGTK
jgi:CRISPR-associated protein, Cse1 family